MGICQRTVPFLKGNSMSHLINTLTNLQPGDVCCGFELIKKAYAASHDADCYIMRHVKTGAELLYFDRADENKTFSIAFKTLPEDNTGVFHILEHSLLNGSEKYPVKEPFVSLLQNSMQTFLNAMTFSDKTVFPVSSRNEQDLFNLMSVYLDGVFRPLIYQRPEIFMQEGWHYEFASEEAMPYYNGVVFSEMKGAFSDVDQVIEDETECLLFPDNSYGFTSGGRPENITDLTYEQFIAAHQRFYHPSNAKIILDGHMHAEDFLKYIDEEYLSKYDYQAPDFDFHAQVPKTVDKTVYYEAQQGTENLAHMSIAKILCSHENTEKIYAAKILADYLAGSNEAPLKRAFLERGLAQDVILAVHDQIYQPNISLVVYNTEKEKFSEIRAVLPEMVHAMAGKGLDKEALSAALERFAFENKEINEPYGVEIVIKAMGSWLYGDDPLTDIDNAEIFDALRERVKTDYFEKLLIEMLGDDSDKSCLYVLPSQTKGEEDAKKEAEKIAAITASWDKEQMTDVYEKFMKMQEWQQSMDSEEALCTLPHLELSDVPEEIEAAKTKIMYIAGCEVLEVTAKTNGIAYLNLYFDISDFSQEEVQILNALTACFGELGTQNYSGDKMQTKIKAVFGMLAARVDVMAKPGDLDHSSQYLIITGAMLEENVPAALEILEELLLNGRYDETDKIYETILQNDYMIKQALIGNGHQFAITKALSAFSQEGAVKELLEGESFVRWFSDFAESFEKKADDYSKIFDQLMKKAFAVNRLFVGYSGKIDRDALENMVTKLPTTEMGSAVSYPRPDHKDSMIEIPGGVSYTALGHNLYALGSRFDGSWAVLTSLMSFGYLWNMIRVQGGAYGTGMGAQMNGNLFSYSYRDPNPAGTREVYGGMADFLADFAEQGMPLDDIIIGTLNMIDPLLGPAGICDQECTRYLKGITGDDVAQIRKEIFNTTNEELKQLIPVVKGYCDDGKFCEVG